MQVRDGESDAAFQYRLLQGVARSFALTIPQLPQELTIVVANAYLLCRISDTIEDESALHAEDKRDLSALFIDVVCGRIAADVFAERFYPLLGAQRLPAEKELVQATPRVIRITHSFSAAQRIQLERCITIMARGMSYFQAHLPAHGLPDLRAFNAYCYHVAGVVGELLTVLYCDYRSVSAVQREYLLALGVSFGQGLQMTNILKDIHEDRVRGVCWLPQDLFKDVGCDLNCWSGDYAPAFGKGLRQMIGIARGHLHNALLYTLQLPPEETGLRKFCLWAIGMALLTLRKIHNRPDFSVGKQVKIRKSSLWAVIAVTACAKRGNGLLKQLFSGLARPLPVAESLTVLPSSQMHAPIQTWFEATQGSSTGTGGVQAAD